MVGEHARRGRALFFRHGIHPLSVLHAGDVLGEGTPKYVIRINIMYHSGLLGKVRQLAGKPSNCGGRVFPQGYPQNFWTSQCQYPMSHDAVTL